MKKILIPIILLAISIILIIGYYRIDDYRWQIFIEGRKPGPSQYVISAIESIESNRRAINVGPRLGRNVLYLLKKGYHVIAIDQNPKILTKLTAQRAFKAYQSKLKTIVSNYEDIPWSKIPKIDLFIGNFSKPFINIEQLSTVFKSITNHIKPGGYLVARFDIKDYEGFSYKEEFKKLGLFQDFTIESLNYDLGRGNVKAQKKPSLQECPTINRQK